MLTLRNREDAVRPRDLSWAAGGIAIAVLVAAGTAIASFAPPIPKMPDVTPGVAEFGRLLFSGWALPFEIASVILLIALVGAVWWSGGDQ
jgi:NADH:ubiquinone oxidoreductase subunit 6 (subunit J)